MVVSYHLTGGHGRLNEAGRDDGDAHARVRELGAQALAQEADGCLGGTVVGLWRRGSVKG